MNSKNYRDELALLLVNVFMPAGYQITKAVTLDPLSESAQYNALNFALNGRKITYRKAKVTPDRPGAFLAVWQRPLPFSKSDNKPIPLTSNELDYLFIQVESHPTLSDDLEHSAKHGMFIFPVSLLIEKGIVSSMQSKGKTGFRVFPPWSQNRGIVGTKIFSESGKKSQRWQLPFFLEIDRNGVIDPDELNKCFNPMSV